MQNLLNLQFVYTPPNSTKNNGNVWSQTIKAPNLNLAQAYSYDASNQLSTAGETTASQTSLWAQTYGYNNGNRWVSASTTGLSPFTPTAPSNFDGSNQAHVSTATVYDRAGNQMALGAYNFTFDAEGRMVSSTLYNRTTYVYDGEGQRVMKLVCPDANPCTVATPGVSQTVYVYDAEGNLAAEYSSAPSVPPCTTCYLTVDHLGSTRLLTDSSGNPVTRYDYLPDGQEIPADGVNRTAVMGYRSFTDGFNPKFTGQMRDTESGLDFLNARYYDSRQGRFISADPDNAAADLSDPLTFNGYAYEGNNPLAFIDPSGLQEISYTPSPGGSNGGPNWYWSVTYGGFNPFAWNGGPNPFFLYSPISRGAPVDTYVDTGDDPINPFSGTVINWWINGDKIAMATRDLRDAETIAGKAGSGAALAGLVILAVPVGAGRGTAAVYQFIDKATGEVIYVGVSNNTSRRLLEHGARFFGARMEILTPQLARPRAIAIEQALIEHHGRWWFGKGTLYNMINSVGPSTAAYPKTIRVGRSLAKKYGILP